MLRANTLCAKNLSYSHVIILIIRVYEHILPCMYCITMYVTQNAVCNCEIKSILTYFTYLMLVCMYDCMDVFMYACIHVCMYVCIFACMDECMYTSVLECSYVDPIHVCKVLCTCMYESMFIRACLYVFVSICMYECMYALAYLRTLNL